MTDYNSRTKRDRNTTLQTHGEMDAHYTAKTEVCISYLGYAPCKSRGMKFMPLDLQGAYPRYGIHTSVFAVYQWRVTPTCSIVCLSH